MKRTILLFLFWMTAGVAEDIRAVFEPIDQTLITSEISSTVKEIKKKMGQAFQPNDNLILLDDVVFAANLMKAEAQVSKAQTDFESAQKLFQDKVISHSDFRQTEAALAVAKADHALAKKAYDACFIKVPYAGKVIDVYVKNYERVQPGQNLIAVLNDGVLIARLLIPEKDAKNIKVGDMIKIMVQETNNTEEAKVVRVGAVIDPVSSLLKVEAEIQNTDSHLRPGMQGILILNNQSRRA